MEYFLRKPLMFAAKSSPQGHTLANRHHHTCAWQGSMLRRLGLTKAPANGKDDGGKDAISVVSRPDPYVQTRFFKVVYPGRVAVRSNPAEPAPENGQVRYNILGMIVAK